MSMQDTLPEMRADTQGAIQGWRVARGATILALAAYWVALFIGTHLPHTPQALAVTNDHLLHWLAYTGLAVLLCINLARDARLSARQAVAIVLVLAIYGALDEWSQIPVGRSCELADWLGDVAGAITGCAAVAALGSVFGRAADTPKR